MVQEGKVNSQFYKPAEDYFTRLKLEMIPLSVVETEIKNGNYYFLLEDGSVVSSEDGQKTTGITSLSEKNRYPFPVLNSKDFDEIALSDSLNSIVGLNFVSGKQMIIFNGYGEKFEVTKKGNRIDVKL